MSPFDKQQTAETIREYWDNFYNNQNASGEEFDARMAAYRKEVGRKNKIRMINAWRKKNGKSS